MEIVASGAVTAIYVIDNAAEVVNSLVIVVESAKAHMGGN